MKLILGMLFTFLGVIFWLMFLLAKLNLLIPNTPTAETYLLAGIMLFGFGFTWLWMKE